MGKVLRANLGSLVPLQGFQDKWGELCTTASRALSCGRRSVAIAAAQLLTGVLQVALTVCLNVVGWWSV